MALRLREFAMGCGRVACSAVLAGVLVLVSAEYSVYAEPRATIELFTSQGCSSCPPADKLLGELAGDPSLVAISLAIDYWDYLGWKDTLALKGHGRRQQAYAKVRGDREVYTPQVVVNGVMHVAGSDRAAIERAIEVTRKDSPAMRLPVSLNVSSDKLTVDIPVNMELQGTAEVWICPMSRKVPVAIERGENRGHTITYNNVVRRWVKLGEWSGKSESFTMPLKDIQGPDIDSVAVMIQKGGAGTPGVILGAAINQLN
jgi:hypothetical protein